MKNVYVKGYPENDVCQTPEMKKLIIQQKVYAEVEGTWL